MTLNVGIFRANMQAVSQGEELDYFNAYMILFVFNHDSFFCYAFVFKICYQKAGGTLLLLLDLDRRGRVCRIKTQNRQFFARSILGRADLRILASAQSATCSSKIFIGGPGSEPEPTKFRLFWVIAFISYSY